MNDKKNDEKLRILQERLSAIKQKETTRQEVRAEENTPTAPTFEENLDSQQPKEESNSENKKGSFWKIIFLLIFFSFLGGFGYYFSTNDFKIDPTIDNINNDATAFSEEISSFFGKNKEKPEDIKATSDHDHNQVINEDEINENKIKYNLNIPDKLIAITASFEDKSAAKAMANNLKVKGYKCNYFFLPDKSNSKEEVYKVFIGPYETKEEINQWIQHLEGDKELILGRRLK